MIINWIKTNRKYILTLLVVAFVVSFFTGCAHRSNEPTAVDKDGNFVSGFKEGYASIDPICEDHWFKRCPEDGSDPYWSWKDKPEPKIIEEKVIPSTQDKESSDG